MNIDSLLETIRKSSWCATQYVPRAVYMADIERIIKDWAKDNSRCIYTESAFSDGEWSCSACGWSMMMVEGTPEENGYRYCPYCGARVTDWHGWDWDDDEDDTPKTTKTIVGEVTPTTSPTRAELAKALRQVKRNKNCWCDSGEVDALYICHSPACDTARDLLARYDKEAT